MMQGITLRSLAAAVLVAVSWCPRTFGDEQAASRPESNEQATSDSDNPLAEVAAQQRPIPQAKAAPTKPQQIKITFQYGDDNSKLVCNVIDERPVTDQTTVARVLAKAASATTIYRPSEAEIAVIRRRTVVENDLNVRTIEETLAVEWDAIENRPTQKTNHQLQPGDQILVKQPAPPVIHPPQPGAPSIAIVPGQTPRIVSFPAPQPAMPTTTPPKGAAAYAPAAMPQQAPQPYAVAAASGPYRTATLPSVQFREVPEEFVDADGNRRVEFRRVPPAEPKQIMVKVRILADLNGSMEAFAPLRDGGFMLGDTDTISGTLKTLEKNSLIKIVSDPNIVCTLGRPAQFRVGAEAPAGQTPGLPPQLIDGTQIDLQVRDVGRDMRIEFRVRLVQNLRVREITSAVGFAGRQTVIMPLGPWRKPAAATAKENDEKPLYVAITPEFVPSAEVQVPSAPTAPTAVATPIPAQWLAQPQPAPAAYSPMAAAPTYAPPDQFGEPQYYAPPARGVSFVAPTAASQPPAAKKPMIKYQIWILEDPSGSMDEFMPPRGQAPLQAVDTSAVRAVLRILEKQKLALHIANPQLVAVSGEQAALRIGSDSPSADQPVSGLQIDVLGGQQRGGMTIEFRMLQTERERQLKLSMDMILADGQSMVAKTYWQPNRKAAAATEKQNGEIGDNKANRPVYVVITPELVR